MNAETQKEFDIKKKFVDDNRRDALAGVIVPGYKEATLWLKNTSTAHINKEATEAKQEAIRKWIEEQKATPEYKAQNKAFKKEAKSTKGYW